MNRYTANVKLGAQMFDDWFNGTDWAFDTNTETLDMSSTTDCMLGQHFESFGEGIDELGLSTDAVVAHGFDVRRKDVHADTYALMDIAWIDEINARRGLATDAV